MCYIIHHQLFILRKFLFYGYRIVFSISDFAIQYNQVYFLDKRNIPEDRATWYLQLVQDNPQALFLADEYVNYI